MPYCFASRWPFWLEGRTPARFGERTPGSALILFDATLDRVDDRLDLGFVARRRLECADVVDLALDAGNQVGPGRTSSVARWLGRSVAGEGLIEVLFELVVGLLADRVRLA